MDRAHECLHAARDEFQAFANAKPVRVEFKFDVQSEWHTAYIECSAPPVRLGVLAGESLYHARSSLEHLVWALVKANKKKPGQHNTFPIRTKPFTQPFWETTRTSSLRGVPKAAAALIEKMQPYHAPHSRVSDHTLAVLDAMAIEDRHRTLHATLSWT